MTCFPEAAIRDCHFSSDPGYERKIRCRKTELINTCCCGNGRRKNKHMCCCASNCALCARGCLWVVEVQVEETIPPTNSVETRPIHDTLIICTARCRDTEHVNILEHILEHVGSTLVLVGNWIDRLLDDLVEQLIRCKAFCLCQRHWPASL